MNASATIRANYVRASVMSMRPIQVGAATGLQPRPPQDYKLAAFKPIDHVQHRENCEKERASSSPPASSPSWRSTETLVSYMDFSEGAPYSSFRQRLHTMLTIFPYRDPIYLVAIVFLIGSLDLVINAFFDVLQKTNPKTRFEGEEAIAIPTTVLLGSILFVIAGILDTFGALNADRGVLETSKDAESAQLRTHYKPALLGSSEWMWIPSHEKFTDLLSSNLAFQAGLIVLLGGIIFMVAGITDFPGIVPSDSPFFDLLVFGPQIAHGAMFLIANLMLAVYEQNCWWKPKLRDPDWQGAFLNAIGGFGFMMVGFLLAGRMELAAAVAAMVGSWAFLVGSLVRWYVVMEFC
ncbi:hypothetical protein BCR34DRAFT_568227 [Clohesyomyces aquaticus]|uniref:Integral membrane protein n=1 Tax=Clohesyomyces aquaticus TaxID=1231657 RepID=A0A1Y1ZH81_9PLEO|nr:hypothetical protein BCR34DRAFT_568227 [Clohesyomyces aquaticus]